MNCVSHTIVEKSQTEFGNYIQQASFKLSVPGLTFYEIYYPTYSTTKEGFSVAKTCFEHCLGQA